MHGTPQVSKPRPKSAKAFWLKQLHMWHWMSSAVSLVGLLLFALTGITLNHAADVEASPVTTERTATLPTDMLRQVNADNGGDGKRPLPAPVAHWLEQAVGQRAGGEAEWSGDDIYLALPRPGGDGWIAIDRQSGAVTSEATSRGWISYLNDLHKGRNAGEVWRWFIDIFAGACFIFTLTGLVLLQLHARKRPSTWPLVATGLALPALLAILFIH
ncbi:PepSY-associated TM helix domain-containing protein [Sphingobium sp. OAS761]|uniref:PepSY-associated TM helix domain-containing protein n=1 Tax=Sphingobium sp. OAS761 TaxID=2817901 RepID=UPI00209E0F47|nr:PepSY-associated TM helix domain-containing protein [Sphingobium sp. OAS761]